jgi:hypothetical protein
MVADDLTHVRGRDQKLEINGRQKRTGGGSLERPRNNLVCSSIVTD